VAAVEEAAAEAEVPDKINMDVIEEQKETTIGDSQIENVYGGWLKHYYAEGLNVPEAKKQALEQTLHKGSLMEIKDWDEDITPGQIADFILKTAPDEVDWWLHRRNDSVRRFLEQNESDPGFRRVSSVKGELEERIQKLDEL
jgi:hypothetical protein